MYVPLQSSRTNDLKVSIETAVQHLQTSSLDTWTNHFIFKICLREDKVNFASHRWFHLLPQMPIVNPRLLINFTPTFHTIFSLLSSRKLNSSLVDPCFYGFLNCIWKLLCDILASITLLKLFREHILILLIFIISSSLLSSTW